MIDATVTNLDDERLIREGEAAVDAYNKDIRNARARIMPMARGLLAARRKYSADRDFGDWLQTSSYREIEKTDRAALINIGEHDVFASKFLRYTRLISPETIWNAIRELLPVSDDRKPPALVTHIIEKPEIGMDLPEKPQSPVRDEAPKERISPVEVGPRHPLHKVRRVDEVFAIFSQANTRGTLNSLIGKGGFGE